MGVEFHKGQVLRGSTTRGLNKTGFELHEGSVARGFSRTKVQLNGS